MDANTAFLRETGRTRRTAARERLPLSKRPWFRVVGALVIGGWVAGCVYLVIRLAA